MDDVKSRLMPLAVNVFASIKRETEIDFPHENLRDCLDSFEKIIYQRGIVWLIDSAKHAGLTHMGWVGWMVNAREVIGEQDA